ncbi:MAG: FAD-binding protein [Deltaproteobacteria bacterium]|nr:FAD-binding protein [Deltaproteobacteria bacterium]
MEKNLVIVGGGAAGPSAAAEAKRGDPALKVTIVEQGPFVSTAA